VWDLCHFLKGFSVLPLPCLFLFYKSPHTLLQHSFCFGVYFQVDSKNKIHLPVNGLFIWSYFLAVRKKITINISLQIAEHTFISLSLGNRVRFLGYHTWECLTLLETAQLLSKVTVLFPIPHALYQNCHCLSSPKTLLSLTKPILVDMCGLNLHFPGD
jgi:hypothetical protein